MECLAPVIDPVVKFLMDTVVKFSMDTITKHVGFILFSTKKVKAMDDKKKQLNETAKDMQDEKERADANDKVVSEHVIPWLEEVKKLNEDAENIQPVEIGCFTVAKRYKAGKQSFNILEKINDLESRASTIKWTDKQKPLVKVGSSTSILPSTSASIIHDATKNGFKSREKILKDAMEFLGSNDENKKMMALCGMGGVGKTTMMLELSKIVLDCGMFNRVVKVVIGENTDPIAFQDAIAEKIGEALTEKTKDGRADRLCNKFAGMSNNGEKKILVIMDDLWKEIDLEDVGLKSPLPKGLKLLFTSRFEDVCSRMGVKTDSIFKVGILNDAEAKGLFFGIMDPSISNGDNPELQKLGEDIVNKCGGLPIAIVTIAKSLKDDIKEAWEAVRSRLQDDDLEDLDSIVEKIFKLSYENLKKDIDKAIFLLSGLFPDDFDIPTEDLLRYGWGLGFFKNIKTLATTRRDMKICVNNLIRANLLTESDRKGCVKMHDLVRAFVLSNFSEVKQASIVNHDNMSVRLTENANDSYKRFLLNCEGMSEFPKGFDYPNLSLLMLMSGDEQLKFPEDFCERMKKLEVISYVKMRAPLLPITLEYSTKLRTLSLDSCVFLGDISFVGSLSNLEILSFARCRIRNLPSTIGNLKRLKLLDLTECEELCIDDGVFKNLVSLEELYMRTFEGSTVSFTDANCDELEILSQGLLALELEFCENKAQPKNVSFKKLERFMISIGCSFNDFEESPSGNTLILDANCQELLECEVSELFEKTEDLYLTVKDMNSIEDVSMHHSFFNLRVLTFENCSDLTYLFTIPIARGLTNLERLTVTGSRILKVLVGGTAGVEVIKFPKLKFLNLWNVPKLISLCETAHAIELPELVELILSNLPNFTSIYPDKINTCAMQSFFTREAPKLKKLDIRGMEKLTQIWPSQLTTKEENKVSMLKTISVRNCESLVNLFPRNPFPLLNHLEKLIIEDCGCIEELFNIDFGYVIEMEEHGSRLRHIYADTLGKLTELWRIKGANNSHTLINGFKGAESIMIINCKFFRNIFTPTTTNFDLGAVTKYLTIRNYGDDLEERERSSRLVENSKEINAVFNGEITERDDNIQNVTYTSHILRTCHHLQELELGGDKRVKVVFEMDNQEQPLLLPDLRVLKLERLEEMSHVWKYNWNKFLIPPFGFPFHNLTTISLGSCHKIKYLFSPLMANSFSNLRSIDIRESNGIEEVVSSRDDQKAESTFSHTNTTFFPHLDRLELYGLPSLKCIDGGDTDTWSRSQDIISHHDQLEFAEVGAWSLCQFPRQINVEKCNALSSLIPWYAVGQMKRLEDLTIRWCGTVMEVFESQTINNCSNVDEGSTSGGTGPTSASPSLKSISVVPQLSNLRFVYISECDLLQHVFTFSTLESLKQLKELRVGECKAIQVIVKEENGEQTTASTKVEVRFPHLTTLELINLPNLKGFFFGLNDFHCPLLTDVEFQDCPQMTKFTSGQLEAPKLKYISTRLGRHSVEINGDDQQIAFPSKDPTISKGIPPWSFYNLIEATGTMKDAKTLMPFNVLLQLQKLEKIHLERQDLVEVFEVEAPEETKSGLNESQTVVEIPNLKEVLLMSLWSLKYLWKSDQLTVLEFPNLTTVSIDDCVTLEHVFTCSMVGSLVQLQDLHVEDCRKIKVIVKEEEKCDAKVNGIMLPRLKSLKLINLPSLEGFCSGEEAFSWQSLATLEIRDCPAITVFTKGHLKTPELKVIETSLGTCDVREFTENLNSFIEKGQEEGVFGT